MKRYGVIKTICAAGLLVITGFCASAQSADNSNRSFAGSLRINSTREYYDVQDSIEVLAYELYTIYRQYPKYSYDHQYDAKGALTGVSVHGISDKAIAARTASLLMSMEVFGHAVRTMDTAYLPGSVMPANFGRVTRKETLHYVPVPKSKEKRQVVTEQKTIL